MVEGVCIPKGNLLLQPVMTDLIAQCLREDIILCYTLEGD